MTPYLTCDAALERLEAFVDGELPMAQQVAVESHLRWCRVCEARVTDMTLIGDSLRLVSHAAVNESATEHELTGIQSAVLTRLRAERDQSFGVQFRSLFIDMRFLWPALGATAAVITCLLGTLGIYGAATAEENEQSMRAMIEKLAHPGSDSNPVSLGHSILVPRTLDASLVLDEIMDDDASYALSAVVTTEGRITNSELLVSERSSVRLRNRAAVHDDEAAAVLAAVSRSRFAPAQERAGGQRVAVSMVWLVARTTVKATAPAVETPKPAVAAPAGRQGSPPRRASTTA